MACCCSDVPCGEAQCEVGRVFICGTLYVSRMAREDFSQETNACCGHAPANGNDSRQQEANSYFSLSFKALLPVEGIAGNYPTVASAQIFLSGQDQSRSYSDNTDGCGNPATYSVETISSNLIVTGEQEETVLNSVSLTLGQGTSNCNFGTGFTRFPCFSNGEETCFQWLRINFTAVKLAERNSSYAHIETNPEMNWNSETTEEFLAGLTWESYFVNQIQDGEDCDWLYWDASSANFEYHEIQNCIQESPCNCAPEPYLEPCEGFNHYNEPLPWCSFSVSDLPIGVGVPTECCSMNKAGMSNSAIFEDTRSFYTDCFGVGTCNDIPGNSPSPTIRRTTDRFGQLEYELQITKWQFIRQEDLPQQGPNWHEELSCV